MVPDVLYRGYRIVSDIKHDPSTGYWRAKAVVVEPADDSGIERVHSMGVTGYFGTQKAALDFLDDIITEAQKWIDTQREL